MSAALGKEDRRGFLEAVEEYRRGAVPLEAPLALLRSWAREGASSWLAAQTYLA